MKELDYEDWQKTPQQEKCGFGMIMRMEGFREKYYTFFHGKGQEWNVSTLSNDETTTNVFKHCAEIKEERRMTNKELSRWLRENPTREYKYENDDWIFNSYEYKEGCEEVSEKLESEKIMENGKNHLWR